MAEHKDGVNLDKLRKDYEEVSVKYGLPSFMELAEEFDIERIERGSSFILRDVRRGVNEKLAAYLHLLETFLNPSSAPMFVFSMMKNIGEAEKKEINTIYQALSKYQIEVFKLDTVYSEKKEAEFIKNAFSSWIGMKNKIYSLIEKIGGEVESVPQGSRGYFG